MKKISLLISFALLLFVFSCQKETFDSVNDKDQVESTFSEDHASKTNVVNARGINGNGDDDEDGDLENNSD